MNTIEQVLQLFDPEEARKGLELSLRDAVSARVGEFSRLVQESLRRVYLHGVGIVEAEVNKVIAAFDLLKSEVGQNAKELELQALAFLNDRYKRLIIVLIASLPQTVEIEKRKFSINEVEIATKISLSASLQAALTQFLTLSGSGELTATAKYILQSSSSRRNKAAKRVIANK